MDKLIEDFKELLKKHSAKIEIIEEEGMVSVILRTKDGFFHSIASSYNDIIIDEFTIIQ